MILTAKEIDKRVSDIANQITSEIANALEMANQIAQKLAALAMAAAMLDPCKLAVLMNTGSPELKSAANAMTSPVTNVIEEVQTELDPRANPEEVTRAVENAKAEAEITNVSVRLSSLSMASPLVLISFTAGLPSILSIISS